MNSNYCQRCGGEIPPGGLFYVCNLRIVCGYDGFVQEPDEDIDRLVENVVAGLAGKGGQEHMDDVYQEIELVLCNGCRLKFRALAMAMGAKKRGKILPFPKRPGRL